MICLCATNTTNTTSHQTCWVDFKTTKKTRIVFRTTSDKTEMMAALRILYTLWWMKIYKTLWLIQWKCRPHDFINAANNMRFQSMKRVSVCRKCNLSRIGKLLANKKYRPELECTAEWSAGTSYWTYTSPIHTRRWKWQEILQLLLPHFRPAGIVRVEIIYKCVENIHKIG